MSAGAPVLRPHPWSGAVTDLRNRPVTSFWKAPKRRRATQPKRQPDSKMFFCPECKVIGEIWVECGLCGGEGLVTDAEIEAWDAVRDSSS